MRERRDGAIFLDGRSVDYPTYITCRDVLGNGFGGERRINLLKKHVSSTPKYSLHFIVQQHHASFRVVSLHYLFSVTHLFFLLPKFITQAIGNISRYDFRAAAGNYSNT